MPLGTAATQKPGSKNTTKFRILPKRSLLITLKKNRRRRKREEEEEEEEEKNRRQMGPLKEEEKRDASRAEACST